VVSRGPGVVVMFVTEMLVAVLHGRCGGGRGGSSGFGGGGIVSLLLEDLLHSLQDMGVNQPVGRNNSGILLKGASKTKVQGGPIHIVHFASGLQNQKETAGVILKGERRTLKIKARERGRKGKKD